MRFTVLLAATMLLMPNMQPVGAAKTKAVKPTATSAPSGMPAPPKDSTNRLPAPDGCPAPVQGGEATADWRPPPIPPKDTMPAGGQPGDGGKAASDWRPPPIPPKGATGEGEAASDWRPPVVPPLTEAVCAPQVSDSADWRPPPIPPK